MLNHKHNVHKRTNSKILLTIFCIFGLLFSWSCSCKNRVSNPDGGGGDGGGQFVDPDTFAIKEATGNVVASIVQSSKTVGDIKIAFTEANNHDYTIDYTVDDANETVEANKIDKTNFKVENNVLTASDSLLTKVRALDSANDTAEKTITINFTFKANDSSLKNNTQTLSVEVKLTKAIKIDSSNIGTILNRISGITWGTSDIMVAFENGDYKNDTYTLTSSVIGPYGDNSEAPKVSEVKEKFIRKYNGKYYSGTSVNPYFTVSDDGQGDATLNSGEVSFSVNLVFTDLAESDMTSLKVKLIKGSGENWNWAN